MIVNKMFKLIAINKLYIPIDKLVSIAKTTVRIRQLIKEIFRFSLAHPSACNELRSGASR